MATPAMDVNVPVAATELTAPNVGGICTDLATAPANCGTCGNGRL